MFESGLLDILALVVYELEALPEEDIECPVCHSKNLPEALECCNCHHSFDN
jgi:hypothetical protein